MRVTNYEHAGGAFADSTTLRNLLAFAGVTNPHTNEPFSEALCFGIAGGIGAGYSYCPSIVRHGMGTGLHVVGRYKAMATDASWYQEFCDRLGLETHVTETAAKKKAYHNLLAELEQGLPTVVWCSRPKVPFVLNAHDACAGFMCQFIVHGVDEEQNVAFVSDRAPTEWTLSLEDLGEARAGVCSHKNRTLTIHPSGDVSYEQLQSAVTSGIQACAEYMLQGRIGTFTLAGLDKWSKLVDNAKNKDGWLKVYHNGLMYQALRDVYVSIETISSGGGLHRDLYHDFLVEAAAILENPTLEELAGGYQMLHDRWKELAESALPDHIKPFKTAKGLIAKRAKIYADQGAKGEKTIEATTKKLIALEADIQKDFPLSEEDTHSILGDLKEQITFVRNEETDHAEGLLAAVASEAKL